MVSRSPLWPPWPPRFFKARSARVGDPVHRELPEYCWAIGKTASAATDWPLRFIKVWDQQSDIAMPLC